MDGGIKDLVNYRCEKAKDNLRIAKELLNQENCSFAVNRAYYAAFNLMRAVNALDGFDSSKHSGS